MQQSTCIGTLYHLRCTVCVVVPSYLNPLQTHTCVGSACATHALVALPDPYLTTCCLPGSHHARRKTGAEPRCWHEVREDWKELEQPAAAK